MFWARPEVDVHGRISTNVRENVMQITTSRGATIASETSKTGFNLYRPVG